MSSTATDSLRGWSRATLDYPRVTVDRLLLVDERPADAVCVLTEIVEEAIEEQAEKIAEQVADDVEEQTKE